MVLRSLKIGTRLSIAFAATTLLTLFLGAVSYQTLETIHTRWQEFETHSLKRAEAIDQGRDALAAGVQNFKNYVMRGKDYDTRFSAEMERIEAALKEYEAAGGRSPAEMELLGAIRAGTATYRDSMKRAVDMKVGGAGIEEIDQSIKGADRPVKEALEKLNTIVLAENRTVQTSIAQQIAQGQLIAILVSVTVVVLTALFAWLVTRSITRPISRAVDTARVIATGDLSQRIEVRSQDETGELLTALRDMNANLIRIVTEVRSSTDSIMSTSAEIASGNADLSSRTEQQAASLEETTSSMEELTGTVQQNAGNAEHVNRLAVDASRIATRGNAVMCDVIRTMEAINAASQRIVEIIAVIDGIAFQTNILALNAAVEAARAGEQGRGFAVVASEVRSLAQRSASAAQEIKGLIKDSVEKAASGSRLVSEAGSTMNEIATSISKVTDVMNDILAASREQAAGIEQVNEAISVMDQTTQQNAALAEQASASAGAMQEQTTRLGKVVSVFRLQQDHAAAIYAPRSRARATTTSLLETPLAAAPA
jgi:methyl-accepting chemotaxis protein